MIDLIKFQQDYGLTRQQKAEIDLALQKSRANLVNLQQKEQQDLKGCDNKTRERQKAFYSAKKKELSSEIERLTTKKKELIKVLESLSTGFLNQLNPVDSIEKLNDAYPILMFPLRLETRFKSTANQPQLWLRVYPDDCNINKKEELLSESELTSAKLFWVEMWKAGGIELEERGAWRSLVNSYGSGRAAWIIKQFKPQNEKPSKPDGQYKILVTISSLSLTDGEQEAAKAYWTTVWLAKGDKVAIGTALTSLEAAVGDVKASEILDRYKPVNLSDEVPKDIIPEQILLANLLLPSFEDYVTTQTSWTKAPVAFAMPDKFVAIAYSGESNRTILFDNPVKEDLAVGPDPSLPEDKQIKKDDNGDLIINEELKWMTDFEKAIEVGMGVKINLTPQEALNGFDKLFVVGIRLSSDATDSKNKLEKLITDHFHSKEGFEILRQGTPTNNTEDESAGYSWFENADKTYDSVFKNKTLTEESDGYKLANSLGIDIGILQQVINSDNSDQLEARAINTALFPATLGYFMEEMMHPLFNEQDIDATKAFFVDYVSGRGPLPAIRIGKQPYGILPISAYSKLKFDSLYSMARNTSATHFLKHEDTFLSRVHALIMKMDETWDTLLPDVAYIGKSGDQHQILLDVLGLHANSVEFHQRYAESIQHLYNKLVLQMGPLFAGIVAAAFSQRGEIVLQQLGIDIGDTKLPILEKYFLSQPTLLTGPVIDDVPLSELNPIRSYAADGKNYIEWLTTSDPDKIRLEDFGGNAAPTSLLYLLLRHALVLAQSDAGAQLLLDHGLIEHKKTFHDPDFLYIQKNETAKSKFEHLYNSFPTITGSKTETLAEYLYNPLILGEATSTNHLRDTIFALKILEKTPTARLERLLAEHLDCCNYRIDAWKNGLVNYRLTEQLKKQENQGIYLGAYGWLLDVKPGNKVLTEKTLSPELAKIFNHNGEAVIQKDSSNLGYIHAPSLNQAATAAILRNAYESHKDSSDTGNPFVINLTSDRVRIANTFLEGMRNGQSLSALLGYQFERGLHDKSSLGVGEVNQFIYLLRKAFPLVADNLVETKSAPADSIETIEANNVIDGLKFINHIQAQTSQHKTYPFGLPDFPPATTVPSDVINQEVERIMDIHDAISDMVITEEVYQTVQGNFDRAAGNAEAFSKGTHPPEIEVVNTPRSGTTLTSKMAIHFGADASSTVSPNAVPMTPRSKAEPNINRWLTTILPDPQKVLCEVLYTTPAQAETSINVSQADLGLQPIDLIYVFNLDTEQAMNELDDRIVSYVIHNISTHPDTDVKINYTAEIDATDKTKVSFFELAALIKSLRKLLIGTKFLTPAEIFTTSESKQVSEMDDTQFKARIILLQNGTEIFKNDVESIITNTKFIDALSKEFEVSLKTHISDTAKIEGIIKQFQADLKNYLCNPTDTNRNSILTALENNSNLNGVVLADITSLKNEYGLKLDSYEADFSRFDDLVKKTTETFLSIAMYDHVQTGVGFMRQGITNIYDSILTKLEKVIERWTKKADDYNVIMSEYATKTPEEQLQVLQKAERLISSRSTFPVPDLNVYQAALDAKKVEFDSLFINLKSLKTSAIQEITTYIDNAEAYIKNIGDFDVVAFDTESSKNDLAAEKILLASLKEDVYIALVNMKTSLANKITACEEFITAADATIINADKISALQSAAKKIFGEEALLLPVFNLNDTQANEFENCYENSEKILDFVRSTEERIFPVEDWLGSVARVREKMQYWENATFLSSAFITNSLMDIKPLQFPFQENDRWLAMKFRDDSNDGTDGEDKFKISGDKLLYSAHFAKEFDKTEPMCGIVFDEWTEVIPAKEETTGIAFHYDQPNSEPPQTILLITPSSITGNWKWDDITGAMEETFEMMKKRAVEPSQIETSAYAQFLPSTMTAVTMHMITASMNLAVNNNIYSKIVEGN